MNKFIKSIFVGLILFRISSCNTPVPPVPVSDALTSLLENQGLLAVMPRPAGLAKTASWSSPIKFIVRQAENGASAIYDAGQYVGSTITDGGTYVLDETNTLVSSVANGVQWTTTSVVNGVDYVVTQTADATTWTINVGLDGTRIVIKETLQGVAWSIETTVPDRIAINGKTYVRLDPVKKVVKAGISYSVKISSTTITGAKAAADYVVGTTAGLAVGIDDLYGGTLNLSLDVLTFAVSNTTGIAKAMVNLDAEQVASRAWSTILAATTNILNWGDLGWCGSDVGWKNIVATNVLVTDYWPPDEQITNLLSLQAEQCRLFGLARLYKGCMIHDACYAVSGKTKQMCDDEVLSNWRNACDQAYSGGYCNLNCKGNVEIYYDILASASPQPFIDAQNESSTQKAIDTKNYNDYKQKYSVFTNNDYTIMNKTKPTSYVSKSYISIMPIVAPALTPVYSLLLY